MSADSLDTTKYNDMVANAASNVKISSTKFKAFIGDVKDVVDQHATTINDHVAENAIDAHGTMPACKVYNSALQSIPSATGSNTAIVFDSEEFDTDDIHDDSTNTDRLTCKTAGVYLIYASIAWASGTTGYRYASIFLNGVSAVSNESATSPNGFPSFTITTLENLSVGDFVNLLVRQNQGSAIDVSCKFGMVKVG